MEWEAINRREYHEYYRQFAEYAMNKEGRWDKELYRPEGEPQSQVICLFNGKPKLMYQYSNPITYFKIKKEQKT